jgi:hypothetical protein
LLEGGRLVASSVGGETSGRSGGRRGWRCSWGRVSLLNLSNERERRRDWVLWRIDLVLQV